MVVVVNDKIIIEAVMVSMMAMEEMNLNTMHVVIVGRDNNIVLVVAIMRIIIVFIAQIVL